MTCSECGEPLENGECRNPWCDNWRMAADFDRVFPPAEERTDG
jgi:hypothetical protein